MVQVKVFAEGQIWSNNRDFVQPFDKTTQTLFCWHNRPHLHLIDYTWLIVSRVNPWPHVINKTEIMKSNPHAVVFFLQAHLCCCG